MKPAAFLLALGVAFFASFAPDFAPAAEGELGARYLGWSANAGQSHAVIVGPQTLVHTSQVLPLEGDKLLGDTAAAQAEAVLKNLDICLQAAGSRLAQAVKLNVYVAHDDAAAVVRTALATAFPADIRPAVCFVTTRLPHERALVAIDAVAMAVEKAPAVRLFGDDSFRAALLPPGPRIYISGQAEKGDGTLAGATKATLASLDATLRFLGVDKSQVVQVKSFLTPMAKVAEVEQELATYFGAGKVPPRAFVEWQSTLPIEIELVVAGKPAAGPTEPLTYLTPPGTTASPIFARVVRIDHPHTIYVSGLYPADPQAAPQQQIRSLFDGLADLLDTPGGSDLKHLAKATYYPVDDEISQALNKVRPDYYDPQRPPAASKALVAGAGRTGQRITIDMIAVPAR